MIRARVTPPKGEPRCTCGKYSMRFCVTSFAYCGRQTVSASRRWRKKLGISEPGSRPPQPENPHA